MLLFVGELTDLHEIWYEVTGAGCQNIYTVLARRQMPEIVM
jgi:hypothetical protein